MPNHTKIHTDTEVFGKISPSVFQAILDVMPAISAALNWEPLAYSFLGEVLRQIILGGNPLSLGHAEFGRILWGAETTKVASKRRVGRAILALTRCQAMSGFLAVWIEPGKRVEKNGDVEFVYTTYRLRDFFDVFADIQALAIEQDLMVLPHRERRQTQLAIVQSVCDARQYQRIPARARQQRHFQSEKAKPEPLPKAEVIPPPRILSFGEIQAAYHERLFQELIGVGIGDAGRALMSEALKATRMTEKRWLDAARSNGKGARR